MEKTMTDMVNNKAYTLSVKGWLLGKKGILPKGYSYSDYVPLKNAMVKRETDKAVLVMFTGAIAKKSEYNVSKSYGYEFWIPKSQIKLTIKIHKPTDKFIDKIKSYKIEERQNNLNDMSLIITSSEEYINRVMEFSEFYPYDYFKQRANRIFNFHSHTMGFFNHISYDIALNLSYINSISDGDENKMIEIICITLTHESIHKILTKEQGTNTSQQFDNIAYRLEKYGLC